MNRTTLIRLQLIILAVLALLVLYRTLAGPPQPDGLVVFTNIEEHTLRHAAFELSQPARLDVQVTGALASPPANDTTWAAYGWLLRRDTRQVPWSLTHTTGPFAEGSFVRAHDTLRLDPGTYDVYYSTHAPDPATLQESVTAYDWDDDQEAWRLILRLVDDESAGRQLASNEAASPASTTRLWTTAPMRSDQQATYLFDVSRPTSVHLYAVGEFNAQPHDYGWIEDVATGTPRWTMTTDNTQPAGGSVRNRVFEGTISLDPGIYRTAFQTNRQHAYHDWRGHPPFDPSAWGLTLSRAEASDTSALAPFDPWATQEPLIAFTEVSNHAERTQPFEVTQPVRVVAHAVGEISSDNTRYDYAELTDQRTQQPIWQMSRSASQPAGGDEDNRVETAFLELEPGTYAVTYHSDRSHAYGDWRGDPPRHPERWGVALFLTSPADTGAVRLMPPPTPDTTTSPAAPTPPTNVSIGEARVSWYHVGNDFRGEHRFTLNETTQLRIDALGEITISGQHDYGWIERADTDETIWQMTLDNTEPAGGNDRNRRFAGVVTLPPGSYVVHYQTDFSHAYGDFDDGAPSNPDAWGLTLRSVEE